MDEAATLRSLGETGDVKVGALDAAYWQAGDLNRSVVFLHGNSAGKEVFYKQAAPLVEAGFGFLAIDLPGHGSSSNSSDPVKDYNFCAFAALVHRVLAELKIERPLLVGWSLGGHVVIEMAGRGYDIAGAMIFGTPPLGPGLGEDFTKAFLDTPAMQVTLNPSPTPEELNTYIQGLYGTLAPIPSAFPALGQRMDGAVREHIGAHWASAVEGCNQRDVVANWDKPLAILHGTDDAFVAGSYFGTLVHNNLWQDKVLDMPGLGHAPFLEAPDAFNEHLLDFSREVLGND